ncbi:ABC transporter ATP-binding protein [Orrella sp. JC864]|uniref:metal ABC transporter ATP-binding protein n=1 Tax=Orrella sp. JC864 TaxID=3120298 RepID=UPI003008A8E7
MAPEQAAASLQAVSLGWPGRVVAAGLTGDFAAGSLTAVAGPNGAGKSTLLKTLMGELAPVSGTVRLAPRHAASRAWLPQAARLDRSFPLRVIDAVLMGAWHRVGAWRRMPAGEWERAWEALEAVGLQDCADRSLQALSGGQFQRVLFARLLVQDARLLLLDEPFAAVDRATVQVLMAVISRWHAQGRTVIAVLHDLALVRQAFPQTLLLAGGAAAWGDTAQVLDAYARQSSVEWLA